MVAFISFRILGNFLLWILCIGFHKVLSNMTYERGMSIGLLNTAPLNDILQVNLPNLQYLRLLPEITHVIPVFTLIGFLCYNQDSISVDALVKFIRKHSALLISRAILFSVTLLPDSSQMCNRSEHIGSCFDLIFSGHSSIMILSTYIINEFFKPSFKLKLLLSLNNIITCILIVLSRNHYTVDVILSAVMTDYIYRIESI